MSKINNKKVKDSKKKNRKRKNVSQVNSLDKKKVIKKKHIVVVKNENVFASINHKTASGANNWTKFSELLKNNIASKKKVLTKPTYKDKQGIRSTRINKTIASSSIDDVQKTRPTFESLSSSFMAKNSIQKSASGKINATKPKLTKHIAMDCEMVGVEMGVNKNMLARISLVNSDGDCVYDKFVKPTEPVVDYRTKVSGVRPKDLETGTDFKTVQEEVADILKSRILIGHALKNDLKVLFLSHPKHSMRDTSKFKKFNEGKTPALKKLVKKYLGATIQAGEHSSVQDALAAMQLYKMFKKEWEASIYSKKHKIKKSESNLTPGLNMNESFAVSQG